VLPAETVLIAGPTGAGKTDLALRLAERLGGEIVGADAFQIYRGMPLLTAQPSAEHQALIPHHLVGSVDPMESFDAGRYLRAATLILDDIAARGRRPIVVGGTGLYVKALLGGLDELPGGDPLLRAGFALMDLPTLFDRLRALDPEAASRIDRANRHRVERALEIVLLTGKPLAVPRALPVPHPPGVLPLVVFRERGELFERIGANVKRMWEQGVEAEVASLPPEKLGSTAAKTLGLREIRAVIGGEISSAEAREAITASTRRYAKRQMTWFRNQHAFPVLNLSRFPDPVEALEESCSLLEMA
jgi:tRNA dimethylallyltransferase